ncbi:vesicular, overexpressed in cancer, prosurvival protein 1 [Strongylocentrotus purpuratus]|uniref:WW domain binding protein VOPP1 n=1 Tax=Strongylocentrotus purpuratus TaxID=7668 RepID=A0A7M7RFX6_STRPU|nr:vesicular, overexpressed in cancer, prosurvival protein 1 [Strongylocentrotus purpuratus]
MWTAIIISLLGILIDVQSVDAISCSYYNYGYGYTTYYRCLSSQYCCGTSSCCYRSSSSGSVYSLWYFWFCIILFFTLCSGASGAYYRKRQRTIMIRTHPAPTVQPSGQTMMVSTTASSGYSGYPQPPPGYAQPPPGYPQPPPTYNQVIANTGPNTGPNMGAAPYPMGHNAAPPVNYNNPQGGAVHY